MYRQLLFTTILLLALTTAATAGDIKLHVPKHVESQKPTSIILESQNAEISAGTLTITYRPGSKVEKKEVLSSPPIQPNQKITVNWQPQEAGIARIDYKSTLSSSRDKIIQASTLVGILFNDTPVSGLVVMCLAALILFGGCFVSLNLLMNGKKG